MKFTPLNPKWQTLEQEHGIHIIWKCTCLTVQRYVCPHMNNRVSDVSSTAYSEWIDVWKGEKRKYVSGFLLTMRINFSTMI